MIKLCINESQDGNLSVERINYILSYSSKYPNSIDEWMTQMAEYAEDKTDGAILASSLRRKRGTQYYLGNGDLKLVTTFYSRSQRGGYRGKWESTLYIDIYVDILYEGEKIVPLTVNEVIWEDTSSGSFDKFLEKLGDSLDNIQDALIQQRDAQERMQYIMDEHQPLPDNVKDQNWTPWKEVVQDIKDNRFSMEETEAFLKKYSGLTKRDVNDLMHAWW
jgi:hypothetical protein